MCWPLTYFISVIELQVPHYKEVIHAVQKSAIDNAMFIGNKCTHYWTLFNAFYFSVTGNLLSAPV